MATSAENLIAFELCPRRYHWLRKYPMRVSLMRALYGALKVGLTAEKDPERAAEDRYLQIAAEPGLDIEGHDVYTVAMHYAKLSGVITAALRSTGPDPWKPFPPTEKWRSACFDMGDGKPRRIAIVDRWDDARRQQEIYGWRTMGEVCSLDQAVYTTAIVIGASQDKRRHSAWTKCYRHPISFIFRFKLRNDKKFSSDWMPQWREDAGISTADWLKTMHDDGCMTDLVHTVKVPVPTRKDEYLAEIERLTVEMEPKVERPPMRLAGCFGFNPCPFLNVCHGPHAARPSLYGFHIRKKKK